MTTGQPQTGYRQVAEHLRGSILSREFNPGEALPSESTLAEQFGLSRPTINKAIRVLIAEGLVEISRGRGSLVRADRPVITTSSSYIRGGQWHTELAQQGLTGSQRLLRVSEENPPNDAVSGALQLDDEATVVLRDRVMMLGSDVVQLATSYYPASLISGTELADDRKVQGGTIAALRRLDIAPTTFYETITAGMPEQSEAQQLGLPAGTPVLRHTRTTRDSGGVPVEYDVHVMRADQNMITQEFPAKI